MAFPAGLTLVTVTGQFDEYPAGGASGWVRFWFDSQLTGAVDLSVVPSINVKVVLDEDGGFEVDLPATNDPGWSPVGFTYSVLAMVGAVQRRGTIQLDYQDTEVRLEDLIQWDNAEITTGVTYATAAQLTAGLATKANTSHQHAAADTTDLAAAVNRLIALSSKRNLTSGETVLERDICHSVGPVTTGTIYITHFKAVKTETILTVQTNTQASGTVAVGTTSAWIGILTWTGTQYLPGWVSVDDPTRWANTFTEYNTPIFRAAPGTGAADLTQPGFQKVADQEYAMFLLWNGSGQFPSLPAAFWNYADALTSPRRSGFMTLAAPPSSAMEAAWLSNLGRGYQAWMRP